MLRTGASLLLAALAFLPSTGCGIPSGSYLRIGGAARVEYAPSPLSLKEKAARFQDLIRQHISPEGLNVYILTGELTADEAMETVTLSDGAIWTGVSLGTQCLRYAVTGEEEAREEIRQLARGLHALHEVTGIRGHFARVMARRTTPNPREGGTWYPGSGRWSGYRWKGDTSKDQYSGIIFGLALAATLSDDPEVKALATGDARAAADHLLENGYQIMGPEGRTTFGDLRGRVWCIPIGVNALIDLAAVKTAAVATGDPRYVDAYSDLIRRGYASAAVWAKFQFFGRSNGNNDVMAMLSLFNLLRLEKDPKVRKHLRASCRRFREYVRYDGNSFFNFILAWGLGGDPQLEDDGALTLRLFPMEKRNFSTDSTGRPDIRRAFWNGWRGRPQAIYPLPINYRPQSTWVWRDNARQLKNVQGEEGVNRAAPTDYLAAYWLGRYLGYLTAEN